MASEILIQINTEFDDSGIRKATQQLERLIAGAAGKGGKNLKGSLDAATNSADKLANNLEKVANMTDAVDTASKSMEQHINRATGAAKKLTAEQERQKKVAQEHDELLERARRANKELAKDLERRTQAEREVRDLAKQSRDVDAKRAELQERINKLADENSTDLKQATKLQKEYNELSKEAKRLTDQKAAAEKKYRDALEATENARGIQKTLQQIKDANKLTMGPIVKELEKFDDALGVVEKRAKRVKVDGLITGMDQVGTATGAAHKQVEKFGQVYNRLSNMNLGGLFSRTNAHLDTLQNNFDQTGKSVERLMDSIRQNIALDRQAAQEAKRAEQERARAAREREQAEKRAAREREQAAKQAERAERNAQRQAEQTEKIRRQAARDYADLTRNTYPQQITSGTILPTAQFKQMDTWLRRLQSTMRNTFQMATTGQLGSTQAYQRIANGFQQAGRAAQRFQSVLQSLLSIVTRLANAIAGALLSALNRAQAALSRFTSSGARFAAMRSSLDATGRSFRTFGSQVETSMSRADRAIQRTAAGWSMIMGAQNMMQMSQTMFRNAERSMSSYLEFEKASTLAAVATVAPGQEWLGDRSPSRYIQQLVFGAQRGDFGAPIRNLSSTEVAQGIYYYGSAIGQDITPENAAAVMNAVVPMLQLAGFTQTSPEQTIKGVLNAAMQFGIDPRDISNTSDLEGIANVFGYLANETTMEVPDISNFFRMVGPLAGIVSPKGTPREALDEIMTWMYVASDYGLRGGQPARGLQQMIQTLISPSGPADAAARSVWGMGIREKFFDEETGTLKGGLRGVIEPFLELTEGEWITLQADMFTNNASRAIIPLIEEMRKNPAGLGRWDEIEKMVASGEFLDRGIEVANQTFSARVQDMKNAWTEFTAALSFSIEPKAFGFLGTLAGGLRELADIIFLMPKLGEAFAGLYAGLAGLLSIGGGLLTFAGSMLILQRAFLIAGQGATTFLTALRAIPVVLGMALPALLAVGAAFVAFRVAWDNNFLGIRTHMTNLRELFSGDFSAKFFEMLGTDRFKTLATWVLNLRDAFTELISGVLFNVGDTNNLFALMTTLFGPRLGTMVNQNLDRLRTALTNTRSAIKDFFSGIGDGIPALGNFGRALQGTLEALFTGGMSGGGSRGLRVIGDWLGIDKLDVLVHQFATKFNRGFTQVTAYALGFAATIGDIFSQIGDNLGRIFTLDNLMSALGVAFNFVKGVVLGFTTAIGGATLAIAKIVEMVTRVIANLGSVGRAINDVIQRFTGFRLELGSLATMIGMVFGARFAGSILMAITPIRTLTQSVTGLITLLGVMAARLALVAAQAAVMAARFVVVRGLPMLFDAVSLSIGVMTNGLHMSERAFALVDATVGRLALRLGATVIVLGAVALGVYALVAAFVGFERANALAQAFFDGLQTGLSIMMRLVENIVKIIGGMVAAFAKLVGMGLGLHNWVAGLLGVGDAFASAEKAAQAFGLTVGLLIGATMAAATANMVKNILGITAAFTGMGKMSRPAIAAIGIGLLALGPHFDTVIGWVNKLIDALNNVSIAGIGVGDMLAGIGLVSTTKIGRKAVGGAASTVGRFVAKNPAALVPLAIWMGYENLYAGEGGFDPQAAYANQQNIYTRHVSDPQHFHEWDKIQYDLVTNQGYTQEQLNAAQREYYTEIQIEAIKQSGGVIPEGMPIYNPNGTYEERHFSTSLTPEAAQFQKVYKAGRVSGVGTGLIAFSGLDKAFGDGSGLASHADRIDYKSDAQQAMNGSDGMYNSLFGQGSLGSQISQLFGMSSTDLAAMFGFTPDGGFSLDSLFNANGLGDFNGKFDERVLDYLPKDLREYYKQRQEYGEFQDFAEKYYGGNERQAAVKWKDMTGEYPVLPEAFDAGSLADLEEQANKLLEISATYREAVSQMSGIDMTAAFFDQQSGKGALGGSVAGFMKQYGDQIVQNVGESEWFNINELFADLAGQGVLDKNLLGKNVHEALKPALEMVSQQTGVEMETLLKDIPKWFAPEPIIASATDDLFRGLNAMPEELYKRLDTFGIEEGWTQFGLDWTDLANFAASKAAAGMDWDFTDYMRESLGMSNAEIQQALDNYNLDPTQLSSNLFETTELMALSFEKGINVVTEDMMNMYDGYMGDVIDGFLYLTEEELRNMPPEVSRLLAANDISVVLVEDADKKAKDWEDWGKTVGESAGSAVDKALGLIDKALGRDFTPPTAEEWLGADAPIWWDSQGRERTWAPAALGPRSYRSPVMGDGTGGPSNVPTYFPSADRDWSQTGYTGGYGGTVEAPPIQVTQPVEVTPEVKVNIQDLIDTGVTKVKDTVSKAFAAMRGGDGGTSDANEVEVKVNFKATFNGEEMGSGGDMWTGWATEQALAAGEAIQTQFGEILPAQISLALINTMSSGETGGLHAEGSATIWTPWATSQAMAAGTALQEQFAEILPTMLSEAVNNALSGISLGGGSGEGVGGVFSSGIGGLANGLLGGLFGGGESGGLDIKINIGADMTEFNAAIQAVGTQGAALEAVTYTVKLDGDTVPLATKIGEAKIMGDAFATNVFTSTLDGDNSPFGQKYTDAFGWGQTFADTTFTASLSGNADPFWAVVNSIVGTVVGTATIQVRAQVSGLGSILSGFFADGGPVRSSGMYMVGEEGPELVMLPQGAHVYNNAETNDILQNMANRDISQRPTITTGVNPSQTSTFRVNVEQKVTTSGQGDGPSKLEINFNGPVYARNDEELKRMTKQVAQEVRKEIARDNQLAERGMTSVDISRPIG